MIERMQSLSAWARDIGVDRHTLKYWLAAEAILLPQLRKGQKVLIRESHIQQVVRKRLAVADLSLLRKKTA